MKTKSLLHSIYLICLAGILTILFLSSMKTMALIMIILLLGHSQKQNHFRFYQRRKPIRIICLLFFILTAVCFDGLIQSRYSNALYAIEPAKTNQQNIKKEASASAIKIHFIDTGNSDCTFIQSQDKNVLIDGGDNDDEQRIVSYLHQLKVKKIEYLISTHPDADHCGGLDAVVTNFDISQTYVCNGSAQSKTYRDFINALSAKNLTPAVPLENRKISLDDHSSIRFFNTKATGQGNELSLVTLLQYKKHNILFMGDATEKTENKILDQLPSKVDILKVSHHGSQSATGQKFLKAIKIKYAVIECGQNNRYNHPSAKVLSRLKRKNIKTLRTDKKGNIIFTIKGNKISYKSYKTTDSQLSTVYIAKSKGSKYHRNSHCSNMKTPQAISLQEAKKQGYQPCQKCCQ